MNIEWYFTPEGFNHWLQLTRELGEASVAALNDVRGEMHIKETICSYCREKVIQVTKFSGKIELYEVEYGAPDRNFNCYPTCGKEHNHVGDHPKPTTDARR